MYIMMVSRNIMKNKIVAMALAMGMSFMVLTACDSGSQPVVEETTETETDVEAEPTEEAIEEPEVTVEATDAPVEESVEADEAEEDVVISLLGTGTNSIPNDFETLSQINDWMFFQTYYDVAFTDEEWNGNKLYRLDNKVTEDLKVAEYSDGEITGVYNIDLYLGAWEIWDAVERPVIIFVIDGEYCSSNNLFPLYYNQTKNCLVAYRINYDPDNYKAGTVDLVELYFNREFETIVEKPVEDPSIYGL